MELGYYDGQFRDINERVIPIDERGHQFGDGVYEFIRVYKGTPLALSQHLDRLERSAKALLIELPFSRVELEKLIEEGLQKSTLAEADIYMQVTRGISPRNHLFPDTKAELSMTIRHPRQMPDEAYEKGISTLLLEDERWANCYIKSLNLLPNILAKQAAASKGCKEAILVKDGYITEGSSSNVFVIKDQTLYTTPATKQILCGITRTNILSCAKQEGIQVREQHMTIDFIKQADEAFVTSTSIGILPIARIDEQDLSTTRPIIDKLTNAYQTFREQQVHVQS
ncbi:MULTISPECIES: D-amino-acid transaminase [Bacillaceae]|uniref:D-amino-acid transaminase n=1 Tax=Bacillaceae TaxID=186817 RepID=UPI00104A4960|nr:D-amino-acid transaminase [Bacillus sp. CBEL-1]TDB50290.1 D-amino-acid transaminase [Bacillus sp. CBEL-1]